MKRLLLLVAAMALLTGCGKKNYDLTPELTAPDTQITQTTAAPVITYQVQFLMRGHQVSVQQVEEGQLPQTFQETVPGLKLVCWQREDGTQADPFSEPVTGDVCYRAFAYPELTNHSSFLFADGQGKLLPDAPLTADDLLRALEALAPEEAREFFPSMPLGAEPMTGAGIGQVLKGFFPAEQVEPVFSGDAIVTRSEFAGGMLKLLGWELTQVVLPEEPVIAGDVTADRDDTVRLLAASVPHTHGAEGIGWEQVQVPVLYEPGFHNIDGWLYYVDDQYKFVKDTDVGKLHFDDRGRYTCGDPELDEQVAQILLDICQANTEADRLELLRLAYEYSRDSFTYLRRWPGYEFGITGWEIQDAKDMLRDKRGNCYNYAAVFWALARGLGYEARAISGTCLSDEQPHGWVIIELDGEDYFFDPEWEMDYRVDRHIYHIDMFKIPMDKIGYWTYKWTEEKETEQ